MVLADLTVSRLLAALGVWSRLPDVSPAPAEAAPHEPEGRGAPDPRRSMTSPPPHDQSAALLTDVLDRARRCGYPRETLVALTETWPTLGAARAVVSDPLQPRPLPTERPPHTEHRPQTENRPHTGHRPSAGDPTSSVSRTGPLTWAGAPARQHDPTTCGSAVLAQLAAAGDPVLAIWIETGLRTGPVAPPELVAAQAAARPGDTRFDALQRALKRRSTQRALLGLPWPGALGTPPWAAARTARYADVRYEHRVVDAGRISRLEHAVSLVEEALRAGIPVPLFSGGTLATGVASAVPRHVVLVTAVTASGWLVYEPSRGEVLELLTADLGTPRPRAALGGWTVPAWVLLPR